MDCADNFVDWASKPIVPHRKGRRKPSMQDGRALRRYNKALDRRAHVRLAGQLPAADVRYDRSLTVYRGFFHIACFMITLRRVLK